MSDAVNEMENHRSNELIHKAVGPYEVLSFQLHIETIKEEGISNTDSSDCDKVSSTRGKITDKPCKTTHTTGQQSENQQRRNADKDAKEATKDDTILPQEYVVNIIMHHVDIPQGRRNLARWSGYSQIDDILESPHKIPTNFIRRYWNGPKHKH